MPSRTIAQRFVDGMVLSTANIYFTTHDNDGAHVFRTAQIATPGHETELCHEPTCRFGDIVFANVDGEYFGYFFALDSGTTTIRRIPLAAQPGTTADVLSAPMVDIDITASSNNLATDGSFLYWQSDTAVNRMSINGGTITVLDQTPLTRPTAGVQLLNANLIYAVDRYLHWVPRDGSAITPPSARIGAIVESGIVAFGRGGSYLAERNGSVLEAEGNGTKISRQSPGTAYITSITSDVSQLVAAWSQMSGTWHIQVDYGANDFTVPTGANPRQLMIGGTGNFFWADDDGLHTFNL